MSADAGAVLGFDAFVPVPDQVGFEVVGEFVDVLVLVVQVVVELLFEAAEEALGGGVVGRAALGAHGPCQPVPFADRDPFGPTVVAAAVGMDDRVVAVLEGGACLFEHAVGQAGRRAGADGPRRTRPSGAPRHGSSHCWSGCPGLRPALFPPAPCCSASSPTRPPTGRARRACRPPVPTRPASARTGPPARA